RSLSWPRSGPPRPTDRRCSVRIRTPDSRHLPTGSPTHTAHTSYRPFHHRGFKDFIPQINFDSWPGLRADFHIGGRMHDPGGVGLHDPRPDRCDLHPVRACGRGESARHCIREMLLRTEFMVYDGPLSPEGAEGHVEVLAGVEVPQDHPVRHAAWHDLTAIPLTRDDVRHPVQPQVSDQVSVARRIQLSCVDAFPATAAPSG